jgi:uncharacterized membrane protein YeaQ/YmgE (transglycosylase-associated protein family)
LALSVNRRVSWLVFFASVFLVSVPVFIEAPLVRTLPVLSVGLTFGWLALSVALLQNDRTWIWGDLLLGFAGSWLAGSIYWGWMRWEPLWHLPIECLALPLPLWFIHRNRLLIGSWFAIGSLFGTAITDLYFYLTNLIDHWRQLMYAEPNLVLPIFHSALVRVNSPLGASLALLLALLLLVVGLAPLRFSSTGDRSKSLPAWAFSGAVLSTILVDALFWIAAMSA